MKVLTTTLDFLAGTCVVLLFLKFAILTANGIFDWNLRWYFFRRHSIHGNYIVCISFRILDTLRNDKRKIEEIVLKEYFKIGGT